MDLDLLYCDFFVNDRELLFHSVPGTVPSFHDEEGNKCTALFLCSSTLTSPATRCPLITGCQGQLI